MGIAVSLRVARACAMFGLDPRCAPKPPAWSARAAKELDEALRGGQLALVTGPSGSGKSSILHAFARRIRARGGAVIAAKPAKSLGLAAIDLFRCGQGRAMTFLARAGLAEAGVMVRRGIDLSEGQRARLWIALAMERLGQDGTLIIDEFASTLDRPTAACLAAALRRWATREPAIRVVCATAHDDVLEPLAPDVLVEQPLARPAVVHCRRAAA